MTDKLAAVHGSRVLGFGVTVANDTATHQHRIYICNKGWLLWSHLSYRSIWEENSTNIAAGEHADEPHSMLAN